MDSSRRFDLVTANIVADVIIRLTPIIKNYLRKDGLFIASGIIDDRLAAVVNELKENGFLIEQELIRDGWCCVVGRYA
jgi:ribosomal protein L11 methyltransferase